MVNPGGVSGGGFRPRVQDGAPRTEQRKETKESKDTKGAEGKGQVKGGGSPAGGVKAKGKAKSADMAGVEGLYAGADQLALEDEDNNRKRRGRNMLGDEEAPFEEKDLVMEAPGMDAINAEFRAQMASGLAAGRSFTRGSLVSNRPDEEEEEEVQPKRRRRASAGG